MTNESQPQRRYFPVLDALRAIASFLVFVRHMTPLFGWSVPKSHLGVDMFFMLSGLVVANAYETPLRTTLGFGRFAAIRLVRLMPLYYVALAFAVAAILLDPAGTVQASRLATLVLLALFLLPVVDLTGARGYAFPLNLPSWSLFFELAINAAYAMVARWLRTWMIVATTLLCAALLVPLVLYSPRHDIDFGWSIRSFPAGAVRVGFAFGVGLLLHRLDPFLPRVRGKGAQRSLAALACAAMTLALIASPPPAWSACYDLGVAILLLPAVIWAAMQLDLGGRGRALLAFLGVSSYSLYILHRPAADLLGVLLRRYGLIPDVTAPVGAGGVADLVPMIPVGSLPHPLSGFLFLALLLALAWLLDRALERPLRDRLRRRPPHRP